MWVVAGLATSVAACAAAACNTGAGGAAGGGASVLLRSGSPYSHSAVPFFHLCARTVDPMVGRLPPPERRRKW
eukprot:2555458-Prymnesium_polylepis.2